MAEQIERVLISHPGVEGTGGPVTRESFESLWEPKGWRIVEDDGTSKKKPARRTTKSATNEEG